LAFFFSGFLQVVAYSYSTEGRKMQAPSFFCVLDYYREQDFEAHWHGLEEIAA
jgi:hypothetical protein